jgi:Plavaka transposase
MRVSSHKLLKAELMLILIQVKQRPFSFKSGTALADRVESLPTPLPKWKAVKVTPNSGTAMGEVALYYRDPVEAIKWLLSRPSFRDAMEFAPKRVWENSKREQRLYTDIFTGEWAQQTQVCT